MIGSGRQAGILRRGAPVRVRRRAAASLGRRGARGRRLRLPRPRLRTMLVLVALAVVLGGTWLWLRDSSLVAVRHVEVTGASGSDAGHIRAALTVAARGMTTLDVNMADLRTAVAPYPVVKNLQVDTQFPHGMRIRVVEQVPVAIIDAGGRRIAVAGDGTLLHDVVVSGTLPTITLGVVPGGTHVTGYVRREVRLLAAAPYPLLAKVATVGDGAAHGLVVKLRNGPVIYFGDLDRAGAKWTAAAEVLADTGSAGAAYIDVTEPSRPVAGAGTPTATGVAGTTSSSANAMGVAGTTSSSPNPGGAAASTSGSTDSGGTAAMTSGSTDSGGTAAMTSGSTDGGGAAATTSGSTDGGGAAATTPSSTNAAGAAATTPDSTDTASAAAPTTSATDTVSTAAAGTSTQGAGG